MFYICHTPILFLTSWIIGETILFDLVVESMLKVGKLMACLTISSDLDGPNHELLLLEGVLVNL